MKDFRFDKAFFARAFDVSSVDTTPVRIVQCAPNEPGYGPYKMLNQEGKIVGYCGKQTLKKFRKFKTK